MRLAILFPGLSARSCSDCKEYVYDGPDDARPAMQRGRISLPLPRPSGSQPPCHACAKIPAGAEPKPENARELSPRHWETWTHYRQCRAVGWHVKDIEDWMVLRNADVIRAVEQQCKASVAERRHRQVLAAILQRGL